MISPSKNSVYGNTNNRVQISGTIEEKWLESWSLSYGAGENQSRFIELSTGNDLPVGPLPFQWAVGENDAIADGTYTLCLKAADKAGWSTECRTTVAIDNTPPVIDVTSPADGSYAKTFEIKGTVSDAHLQSYKVEMSEGDCSGTNQWSTIAAGTTIVQDGVIVALDILPPDNTYCVRVTATDQVGNTSTLARTFKIDTKPPTPPVLSGTRRSQTEIGLSWTQSGESDIAGYNLYKNGSRINSALITGTSYNDSRLAEGAFVYTVTAVNFKDRKAHHPIVLNSEGSDSPRCKNLNSPGSLNSRRLG